LPNDADSRKKLRDRAIATFKKPEEKRILTRILDLLGSGNARK
jgi:hypothetical protein